MSKKDTLNMLQIEEEDITKQIIIWEKRKDIEMVSIFMSLLYSTKVLIAYTRLG